MEQISRIALAILACGIAAVNIAVGDDRFKAALFVALGYSAEQWEVLRDDILTLARTGIASPGQPSPYGRKFELDGILTGPFGRSAAVRTVWIFRPEEQFPRFVTALPR